MSLVKVFGNTYINTDAVGKVKLDVVTDATSRTNKTTIYDLTGQHVLAFLSTTVNTNDSSKHNLVKIDNFLHEEVITAIRLKRDARGYEDGFAG